MFGSSYILFGNDLIFRKHLLFQSRSRGTSDNSRELARDIMTFISYLDSSCEVVE